MKVKKPTQEAYQNELNIESVERSFILSMDELAKKLKEVISREPQHIDYDMTKYDWDKIAREVKDIYLSEK